jgi:hypothetical protein
MDRTERAGDHERDTSQVGDTIDLPVTLAVFGAAPVVAVATVRQRSLASRVGRAGLALGIAWLLVFPAIFFPVAHLRARAGAGRQRNGPRRAASPRGLYADAGSGHLPAVRCEPGPDARGPLPAPGLVQCVHCRNELTLAAPATPV